MGEVVPLRAIQAARPLRLVFVAGTRPEAIKLAPLLLAARWNEEMRCTLIATGQHGALFDEALAVFDLVPDLVLGPSTPGLTIDALHRRIAAALPVLLDRLAADCVIVQGDTTSAWAAALTARRHGTPVVHVEAGLRSGDPHLPWPEERNRAEIDHVADLLFAPSATAAANLRAEGVAGRIHVTGNSGIDALLQVSGRVRTLAREDGRRTIFVTCHRRENAATALDGVCAALRTLARRADVALVVALPGDPAKALELRKRLSDVVGITLEQPLDFAAAVARLKGAYLVLSDSGGLQEECAALGVPLLVLRPNSERPEVVATGNARLVGSDAERIVAEATRLLDDPAAHQAMARASFPYGSGDAAERMLGHLALFPFPRA